MSEARENLADYVKKASQWFEVDLVIRIFGIEILHLHFPPKNS